VCVSVCVSVTPTPTPTPTSNSSPVCAGVIRRSDEPIQFIARSSSPTNSSSTLIFPLFHLGHPSVLARRAAHKHSFDLDLFCCRELPPAACTLYPQRAFERRREIRVGDLSASSRGLLDQAPTAAAVRVSAHVCVIGIVSRRIAPDDAGW